MKVLLQLAVSITSVILVIVILKGINDYTPDYEFKSGDLVETITSPKCFERIKVGIVKELRKGSLLSGNLYKITHTDHSKTEVYHTWVYEVCLKEVTSARYLELIMEN